MTRAITLPLALNRASNNGLACATSGTAEAALADMAVLCFAAGENLINLDNATQFSFWFEESGADFVGHIHPLSDLFIVLGPSTSPKPLGAGWGVPGRPEWPTIGEGAGALRDHPAGRAAGTNLPRPSRYHRYSTQVVTVGALRLMCITGRVSNFTVFAFAG